MPPIHAYACTHCDFELPTGWGGYVYVVDNQGKRIVCPHPAESSTIEKVTGLTYDQAQAAGRVGYAQHAVCPHCLHQFDFDLDRDSRRCPACGNSQIRTLDDSVNNPCPKCKTGVIQEQSPIRWKLDPGWESLPVPQIVKDLLQFIETRLVPPSLQDAENATGGHLLLPAQTLLRWWEGDYLQQDQEPPESIEMHKKWIWCKALPAVLSATPALAELITIRKNRCWFAPKVSPDTKRGIKNYLRKHRKHEIIS